MQLRLATCLSVGALLAALPVAAAEDAGAGAPQFKEGDVITFEQIDKVLRAAMPYYRANHLLDETPLKFNIEKHPAAATPLRFPSKIAVDEASGRLFIADSNHNRVVVAKIDGTLLDTIGSGVAGVKDGDFTAAQFNQTVSDAAGVDVAASSVLLRIGPWPGCPGFGTRLLKPAPRLPSGSSSLRAFCSGCSGCSA